MAQVKIIPTPHDTIAAKAHNCELLAIPIWEDSVILGYALPDGDAAKVAGKLYLPENAIQIFAEPFDGDCYQHPGDGQEPDILDVYIQARSLLAEWVSRT